MTAWVQQIWSQQRGIILITGVLLVGAYVGGAVFVDGFSAPAPVIILGVIIGLTYGVLAAGLVLVYRTSGVINFAHGEVGTLAASLFGVWVAAPSIGGFGLPYWMMFPAALVVGAAANVAVALVLMRLRSVPRAMSLVLTLGAAQLFLLIALTVNTKIRTGSLYPRPPGAPSFDIGALRITPEYSAMLIMMPTAVLALAYLLNRTRLGIALRAAADNRDSALMSGISTMRASLIAWALAGMAAALVAVLQFPQKGFVLGDSALGPGLLVRALLAAVVARLASLPVALVWGVVVGIIEQVALWNSPAAGTTEIGIFILLLAVLLTQSRASSRIVQNENWIHSRPWQPIPPEWRVKTAVRAAGPVLTGVSCAVFLAVGLSSNRMALALTLVVAYTIVALSVYVTTGLAGHISFGQFAIAGVGAAVSLHIVDSVVRSLVVGILGGGLAGAAVALVIGVPALRIRGLMLAVATLSFAVAAQAWLFSQPWVFGDGARAARLVVLDEIVTSARGYFLFAVTFLLGALWLVGNVARGGYGRTLRGLRDNEEAARAFSIPATRRKLETFAFSGFLAGIGGAVLAHGLPRVSSTTFAASESITVVAIALLGGLAIKEGPLLGALFLVALPALVRLDEVELAASTLGWVVVLLAYPGGLADAIRSRRDWVLRRLAGSAADETAPPQDSGAVDTARSALGTTRPLTARETDRPSDKPGPDEPVLETRGLSRSFGGVRAVSDVSIVVPNHHTLGVIGANGAGKTTLFELIGGFTAPDSGVVLFDGHDVTRLSPERRAALGMVRSFQDARLFPTLTVRETVALAFERAHPSSLAGALVGWPTVLDQDRRNELQADDVLDAMGLGPYTSHAVGALSTGTRRITELAAIIAMQPRLVLLDEPSSGIAQRESEALGSLLQQVRSVLGTTLVVIEHDMPLLLRISDSLVAMEGGQMIAQGSPDSVIHNPDVVASYLGTSREAIERSGQVGGLLGRA